MAQGIECPPTAAPKGGSLSQKNPCGNPLVKWLDLLESKKHVLTGEEMSSFTFPTIQLFVD